MTRYNPDSGTIGTTIFWMVLCNAFSHCYNRKKPRAHITSKIERLLTSCDIGYWKHIQLFHCFYIDLYTNTHQSDMTLGKPKQSNAIRYSNSVMNSTFIGLFFSDSCRSTWCYTWSVNVNLPKHGLSLLSFLRFDAGDPRRPRSSDWQIHRHQRKTVGLTR